MILSKKLLKSIKSNSAIIVILFLALILRLYRFNFPLADWHRFRQADTASVTREYVKTGRVDWLRPKYQDLSNIQSGFENPEGYRMVEFPLINGLMAHFILLAQKIDINLDLVQTSRAWSIAASLIAIYALFRLVKILNGEKMALLAAFIYAVLPYAVFYGRAILPEPFMLAFSLLSLWQWAEFSPKNKQRIGHYFFALIFLMAAALLKPFVVFLAPVYLAIALNQWGKAIFKQPLFYLFPLLAFLPMLAWREWIKNFPEGIPVSDWLLNGNGIRLRPAWWRWLFYERLTKLFFGYVGLILILANSCKIQKACLVYFSWWLAILLYFVVVATGNIQHDYYQNLVIPIACISMARGGLILLEKFKNKRLGLAVLASILAGVVFFSGQQVAGYFNVNNWEYVKAGQAVDRLAPSDALVIAPAMGDTFFLFQTNRRGWPIGFYIEQKIAQGVSIYVSTTDDDERRALEAKYLTLEKTDEYLILDLSKEKP